MHKILFVWLSIWIISLAYPGFAQETIQLQPHHSIFGVPAFTSDSRGTGWMVWSAPTEAGYRLFYSRGEAVTPGQVQNAAWSSAQMLNFSPWGIHQYAPAITLDPAGYPWVVWVGYDGRDEDLFYSRWIGSQWTTESKVVADASSLDKAPSIAMDSDGVAWVTWTRWKDGQKDIYITRWDGFRWTPPQQVNSQQVSSNLSPTIVVDHHQPWIFWSGFDGTDDDIYYSYWNGTNWQPEARVNHNDAVPDITPSAMVDENGTLWVTWSGFDGQTYRSYYSYWTSNGWAPEDLLQQHSDPAIQEHGDNKKIAVPDVVIGQGQRTLRQSSGQALRQAPDIATGDGQHSSFQQFACPKAGSLLDNNCYIAFGDSITDGVGDEKNRRGYPSRLDSLLDQQVTPSTVLNEGISGETTSQGVDRIDALLEEDRARYILLMEGTNDIFFRTSTNTTIFNLSTMVDKSRAFGTIPLLATILPLRNLPGDPPTDPGNVTTQELNEKIRQLARDKGITLVDQFQAFITYPNYQTTLYADSKHPNARGYDLMAETWLNGVLKTRIDGAVSVLLNNTNFSTFDILLAYIFLLDESGAGSVLDLYVRLQTPGGTVYYLVGKNQFGPPNKAIPLRKGLSMQNKVKLAMSYLFQGTETPGLYTWTSILVLPGTEVGNTKNWISSYSISFTFLP